MQDAAPRRVQLAVAGFAAAALLAAQMPVEAADVKTVVCASNPTSKICLKVSCAESPRLQVTRRIQIGIRCPLWSFEYLAPAAPG